MFVSNFILTSECVCFYISQGDNSIKIISSIDERAEVDDLVNSLLISTINEPNSENSPIADALTPTENIPTSHSTSPLQVRTKQEMIIEKTRKLTLSKCIGSIHILPIVKETYEKQSQTDDFEDFNDAKDVQETPRRGSMNRIQSSGLSASIGRGAPIGSPPSSPTKEINDLRSPFSLDFQSPKPVLKLLSSEDQSIIYASEDFQNFMESTSKIVERSLGQRNSQVDILRNYKIEGGVRNALESKTLSSETIFEDESVKMRPVMDLQCSPHFSELFLVSYGTKNNQKNTKNSSNISGITGINSEKGGEDTPGMVAVWSLATPARPEFRFSASSPVLTARFRLLCIYVYECI